MVFPFTSTPELARRAAAACHYPPGGLRGSGADLAQFRWPAPEGYYDFADRMFWSSWSSRTPPRSPTLMKLPPRPGIDVLFIGTSDLSFSLGLRGSAGSSEARRGHRPDRGGGEEARQGPGPPGAHRGAPRSSSRSRASVFSRPFDLGFMTAGAQAFLEPLGRSQALQNSPLY